MILQIDSKEVAIILGNGTSLVGTSEFIRRMKKTRGASIFGVNRVFLPCYSDLMPIDFYLALDRTCWHNNAREIMAMKCKRYFVYEKFYLVPNFSDGLVAFSLNKDQYYFSTLPEIPMGHFHTSIAPCVQIAVMSGCKEIHFFGVDCKPGKNGLVHPHDVCATERKEKTWSAMRTGVLKMLESLQNLNISYEVHSELFDLCEKKYVRNL